MQETFLLIGKKINVVKKPEYFRQLLRIPGVRFRIL